jgi:hypothetical protein
MASLSNINGIFDVHSTGAIQFNGNHGASGQILKSNGNAAPTWIPQSDIVGAYLPLSGGTLTGATATATGISFTVGGVLTTQGPDGGLVLRSWTGGATYGMLGTANMSGSEYSLLTDGTDTFLSGGANGSVYIRSGNNTSTHQLVISSTSAAFAGTISLPGTAAQYVTGTGALATFPAIPQGDITGLTAGTGITIAAATGPVPTITNSAPNIVQTSVTGGSGYLDTNRGIPSSAGQYWQASGLGTTEAPSTDWYNTWRGSHGSPLSYYSNTLAIKMTGTGPGTIYTQTIQNGTALGWNKYWHDGNLPSGSGVTSVATGNGLTGGTITGAGTLTMSGSYSGAFTATDLNATEIYANSGWFRNNTSGKGLYNSAVGNHFYSDGGFWNVGYSGTNGIILRNGHQGTIIGYLYGETSGEFGLLDKDGQWTFRTDGATVTELRTNNVIKLSQTTTHTTIGQSTTINGDLTVGNSTSSNIFMSDSDHGQRQIHCNSDRIGFLTTPANAWGSYCGDNGDWTTDFISYAGASMRAPIFYDRDNTSYYINPASTSYINSVTIKGLIGFPSSGLGTIARGGNSYAIYQESGGWTNPYPDLNIGFHTGISIGAHGNYQGTRFFDNSDMVTQIMSVGNTSDPLSNNNVYVNNSLQAGSSLRAPIFYDSNNTVYYSDLAGLSVLNTLNLNSTNLGTTAPSRIQMSNDNTIKYCDFSTARQQFNLPAGTFRRLTYSTSSAYAMGTYGWGAMSLNALTGTGVPTAGSGFFDVWSNPAGQPAGTSHWDGVQSYHHNNGSSAHGWQMLVGAGNTDLMYVRGIWGGSTWGSWYKMHNDNTSICTATNSFRAPYFYDSTNTAYYTRPASTSIMNVITFNGGTLSGTLTMNTQKALVANNYGRGVYGVYTSTVLQHLFSMGTSYNLADNGSSAGNLYGVAWSHQNAGTKGGANNLTDHGMLLINNGGFRASISNSIVASSYVKGTQFIDWNNSAYYLDPASTSNLNIGNFQSTSSGTVYGTNHVRIGSGPQSLTGLNLGTDSSIYMIQSTYSSGAYYKVVNDTGTPIRIRHQVSSFDTGAYTDSIVIFNHNYWRGYVGILRSPEYPLDLAGQARLSGGYTTSDERLKENIRDNHVGLTELLQLRTTIFDWITDREILGRTLAYRSSLMDCRGFIAQEVELVAPELVDTNSEGDGAKSIDDGAVTAMLVKAIQEQQVIIEDLKSRLQILENN